MLKEDLIKVEYQERKFKYMITSDKYFYRISDNIKHFLLQQESLCKINNPIPLEDITFFNNNKWWLETITHEKLIFIHPKDENEIKTLKEMGLEFEEVEDYNEPIEE